MRHLAGIALLLLLACPALAVINITPVSVGESYIVWEWNAGLDLTDMWIDGNVMCGYNTTDNMYVIAGLHPAEEHNITVYTSTDLGTNTTFTHSASAVPLDPQDAEDNAMPMAVPVAGILGMILLVWKQRKP